LSDSRRALATLCLLLTCTSAVAEDWLYTIRPGDEIWNIASRYCGSPAFSAQIIEYNKLANERAIRPGSRLRIPIEWLIRQPVTAEILNIRGQVLLLTPEPDPARVGDEISMGDRLTTNDGSAVVGFADGSTLTVAAQSDVLFNVLTAFADTGMVDTSLRFYRGRGTTRVIRRNDASRFRISSPAGTAAVRGTQFRFAVAADKALTETLGGEVGFLSDTETSVPAGFGLAASPAGVIREKLLPAPVWTSSSGQYGSGATLHWTPVTDATAYRASVYLRTSPATPVQVQLVSEPALSLGNLGPAEYVTAVRAISASDLEGFESQLAFSLGTEAPTPEVTREFTDDAIPLSWQATSTGAPYTVEIAEDPEFTSIILTETGLSKPTLEPSLNAGHYFWRAKDQTSIFSDSQAITIRPVAPEQLQITLKQIDLGLQWQSPRAEKFDLTISRNPDLSEPVIQNTLNQAEFTDKLPGTGTYYIEVVAITNGIRSTPTTAQTTATSRPPWWLLGLLALPLLL